MKYVKRIAAAVLVLACIFLVGACTPSKKVQDKVYNYLEEKYRGLEFELLDYKQDKETSGRYTVSASCKTTNVDFELLVSAMYVSDSYSVRWANSVMDEKLMNVLGDAKDLTYVSDAQWMDLYEDGSNGYRFREVDTSMLSWELQDVKEIYRITLSDVPSADEAAQGVYMTVTLLSSAGVNLDKVTFDIQMAEKSFLFSTSTAAIKEISLPELEEIFASAEPTMTDGNIFYQTTAEKSLEYFGK